jgi:CBS domain-containing protein
MNRELLAIRPDLPVKEALELLHSFQIGAAPVLDEARRPVGVVSIRDLIHAEAGGVTAQHRMSRPALCIPISATVEQAAQQLARMNMHHLVVVDGVGIAVGMVSTLDALRALFDLPARHPKTFPHWDETTGASWTEDWPLDADAPSQLPESGGVLALTTERLGEREAIVWAEAVPNLRERVRVLSSAPLEQEPALRKVLETPGLRVRAVVGRDEATRSTIVGLLHERIKHMPTPGAT